MKLNLNYFLLLFGITIFLITGCNSNTLTEQPIKIGIITDLTGPVAYWGESTIVGAELAVKDLEQQGILVELLFEDYMLDAKKAVSASQKLVEFDAVDGLYVEFNPGAVAVGSYLKEKQDEQLLFVYDAAITSPLETSDSTYKTYLNYQKGCKQLANSFKQDGVSRIGVLKLNLEAGELCLRGVQEIYGDKISVESYSLGDSDVKTQLLKLKERGSVAVINVAFEGETLNALKVLKEQNIAMRYGTVDDSITSRVLDLYSLELQGSYSFGFSNISNDFLNKISSEQLTTNYGAALAYIHIFQMGKALAKCDKDMTCVRREMDNSIENPLIGFEGFKDHVAVFAMSIQKR